MTGDSAIDKHLEVVCDARGTRFSVVGAADDFGVIGAIERGDGSYEPHLMEAVAGLVRPDSVCIDIGANIGVITLFLAGLCPRGTVYAFEPGAKSFGYLQRNIAANDATNVRAERLGVGDVTGDARLNVNSTHPGGAFFASTDAHEAAVETVPVTRLDDWVKEHGVDRVDFMKLDIEGAELLALDGAEDVVRRHRPIMVIECNPVALWRFQRSAPEELHARLRSLYGSVCFLDGSTIRVVKSDEHLRRELDRRGMVDLVCGVAPSPPTPASEATLSRRVLGRARRELIAWRGRVGRAPAGAPGMNFVHRPSYVIGFDVNRLALMPGALVRLPVRVANTGRNVFSSQFPDHPVSVSYHWMTPAGEIVERDGIRSFFARPLAPGATTTLDLTIAAPTSPGEYLLVVALVQESFAWFDDLAPELAFPLPVVVRSPSPGAA